MHADFAVLLDACVLVNYQVTDIFLRLAEEPRLYSPKWSNKILEEVYNTHCSWPHWKDEGFADSFQKVLREHFPEALITGFEELIPLMENDHKDRHVLAAAVKGKIQVLITFNTKDFKKEAFSKWDVTVLHPQDYLITLFQLKPNRVIQTLDHVAHRRNESREDVLIRLGAHLPAFSSLVLGA